MTAQRFFVQLQLTEHLTVLAGSRAEAIVILEDALHRGALDQYKTGQKPEASFLVEGRRQEEHVTQPVTRALGEVTP